MSVHGSPDRAWDESSAARRSWLTTLRSRVFAVVALSAVPALVASVVGLTALARVNDNVGQINRRSVATLTALADLRDMEGDTRVVVRDYIDADARERADVAKDLTVTDRRADADIAAYLAAHGNDRDRAGVLMATFRPLLLRWRAVRDQQVVPLANAGKPDQARTVVGEELAAADDAMATPLDALFEEEARAADARVADSRDDYDRARVQVLAIIGAGLLGSVLVAWLLIRRPIGLLGRVTRVVTSGDLTARVDSTDLSDVGVLGRALDELLGTIVDQQEELAREQAAREQQMTADFARQRAAEQEVRLRAQSVIDETSTMVLSELRDVVAQAEVVRGAAAEIDSRTGEAEQVTRGVIEKAEDADQVVGALTESLRRVGGIAQMIAGVAEQTNLLALNATIEAARAGQAGKGFSVVASEVKGLAAATGRSTTEIASTVGTLESDTSAMAQTIAAMSQGVAGMGEASARVSEVAGRQRESVERLDRCVREAIAKIEAMSEITEQLERRAADRARVSALVTLHWAGGTATGQVIDISETGIRCAAPEEVRPPEGATVRLEIELMGRTETVNALVVRCTPPDDGPGFAATFVGLSPMVADRIREYLRYQLEV